MIVTATIFSNTEIAHASTIEKWLIMPGPVVSSHADVEEQCDSCHDPLSDRPQVELCVVCHVDVGTDISESSGFHGRLPEPRRSECSACHAEHEGRDLDIVELDESSFDHMLTDFALHGAHATIACGDCHSPDEAHRDAGSICFDCHKEDDPHKRQLGDGCDACHTVNDWLESKFDHSQSSFPLTGAHATTACAGCHLSSDFSDVGKTCIDCHKNDDVHKGRNGTQCMDCHGTDVWSNFTFNHLAVTGFALHEGHGGLGCTDCHRAENFLDLENSTCNSCHLGDDVHQGRNGTDCQGCHDISDWQAVDFDHSSRTDFALPPGHQDLECTSCHTNNVHDEIPRDCGGCHVDDDPHKGQLGPRCEGCHVADHWTAHLWFDHDLTTFPLLGIHADVSCDQCHASPAYRDTGDTCIDCHKQDDPHDGGLGSECGSCHNPSTWRAWTFDHDTHTDFALTGAHVSLACNDCHAGPGRHKAEISGGCWSCHRRDDPHSGRFGNNCETCHTTSSFSQIEGM